MTSETVLYRKYRPQAFADVAGQDHVVSVLQGAVKNGTFTQAYLFSGTRGTGKTSVARIFAKAIECADEDIHEMDAASHTSVEDVRELRDAVSALPLRSPYKVYIIDEVHMLSKSAFNALLKTLEEPPAHVVFILATTEPEKLPDTIHSRCQRHTFRSPNQSQLREFVTDVAKKEGYELESGAADLLALLAEGSYRDAHGMLQKVFSTVGKKKTVDAETAARVTGAPKSDTVNGLLRAVAEGDAESGLAAAQAAAGENIDPRTLLKLLLHKARAVMLARHAPQQANLDQFSEEDRAIIGELAKQGSNLNSRALVRLLDAYTQTARAAVPYLPLELAIADLAHTGDAA